MREVATGVADIAFVTPIYEKSGVDLTKAMVDFYKGSDPLIMSKIYWELFNKFPEIRKEHGGSENTGSQLRHTYEFNDCQEARRLVKLYNKK